MTVLLIIPLNRGFVVNQGDNDLAVLSIGLAADDDIIIIQDTSVDHAVTPYTQHEQLAIADKLGRQGENGLRILLGQNRTACCNTPNNRNMAYV